jgi:hypothetical protein
MSSGIPVGNFGGISDALLQAMSSEGAERNGGRAVDTADCPEGDWHGGSGWNDSNEIVLKLEVNGNARHMLLRWLSAGQSLYCRFRSY